MPDLTLTLTDAKFRLGAHVLKTGKYKCFGRVVGYAIGELGNVVYVVEHTAQVEGYFMHVYSGDVLELHAPPATALTWPAPLKQLLDAATITQTPPSLDPVQSNHGKTKAAQARGYSGNVCESCGGLNMVRTGTCETCQDCGWNKGCG